MLNKSVSYYRCEASTTKQRMILKYIYINEFPSIKIAPFDAEFDSASNGDTFIHGKTIGKNSSGFFLLYVYV